MKLYILILLGIFLTSCGDEGIHFTPGSELDDPPFRRDLESRLRDREEEGPGSAEGDTIVDLIIRTRQSGESPSAGVGGHCKNCRSKVDIHFYIGFNGWTKPTFWHSLWQAFPNCLNKFARYTNRKGFLEHLQDLDWQFSHSLFSSGTNQPGYLEYDGKHIAEVHRTRKRRYTPQFVLNRRFAGYEDIFTFTLHAFNSAGDSFYHNHTCAKPADCQIQYDAPKYNPEINKGGLEDPLAGLSDILTNKYGAIRTGSRVEIFIATDYFPDYSDKDIRNFAKKYRGVRIHLLSSHSQSKFLGSLRDIARKTGGTVNQLCSDINIGPKLAKIVRSK